MRSPYKAYRSPFGPQYVFSDINTAVGGVVGGLGRVGWDWGGVGRGGCVATPRLTAIWAIGCHAYARDAHGKEEEQPNPTPAPPLIPSTPVATSKLQTLTYNHRYTIPKNYHGLTLKQAAK